MALEQRTFERLQGTLDGVRLVQDVNTVLVGFDHLANTLQVALDRREAVQDLLLVALHGTAPRFEVRMRSHPPGDGVQPDYMPGRGAASTPSPRGWERRDQAAQPEASGTPAGSLSGTRLPPFHSSQPVSPNSPGIASSATNSTNA